MALENDVSFLKVVTQELKDDLDALNAQVLDNTNAIELIELDLVDLEAHVLVNSDAIETLDADALALKDGLESVRLGMTALEAAYTGKIVEIETAINNLNMEVTTILEILPSATDMEAIVGHLAEVAGIQQQILALESFKEETESLVQDLNAKVVGLEAFDMRIDFLLDAAGIDFAQKDICLWDHNSACNFHDGTNFCDRGYSRNYGANSRTFNTPQLPASFSWRSWTIYISASNCSSFTLVYAVELNGVTVGQLSLPYSCGCYPPLSVLTVSAAQIEANYIGNGEDTLVISRSGYALEAEYSMTVTYE